MTRVKWVSSRICPVPHFGSWGSESRDQFWRENAGFNNALVWSETLDRQPGQQGPQKQGWGDTSVLSERRERELIKTRLYPCWAGRGQLRSVYFSNSSVLMFVDVVDLTVFEIWIFVRFSTRRILFKLSMILSFAFK